MNKVTKNFVRDSFSQAANEYTKATEDIGLWESEEKIWAEGKEDERVYEYGDKILPTGEDGRDTFIHFPDRQEIVECLKKSICN